MSRLHAGSLDRRLARWLALLALVGLTLTCLGVYTVTALSFEDRQADTLRQKQLQVRHLIAEAGVVGNAALTHKLDDAMVGRQDLTLVLTDAKGQVLYAGPTAPPLRQTLVTRFEAATASGPVQATLTLDTTEDDRVMSRLARTLAAAALTGSIIIAIGGFTLVQLGLRPVRNLAMQVQALAADTLDRRLDGSAQPEELAPLVQHVNDLLDRLHRAYEQLEAFNADVAHELFTPLTTLIGGTEVALRKAREADELRDVLGEHLEELQRMSLIVQDMLFLSQADRGATARRETVQSLADVAGAVAELHEAHMEEAGLRWRVDGDARGAVDARLLQRALSNLIGNATRHAQRGSEVVVRIEGSRDEASLSVVNQGATIAPEHLPRLFDRFYRIDASRSGAARNHGLGLAIVAAIARMHGGRVVATSSDGITSIGLVIPTTPTEPA